VIKSKGTENFLLTDRARIYIGALFIVTCVFLVWWKFNASENPFVATDFPAFYVAGKIVNERPASLYDKELQRTLYRQQVPEARGDLLFAYTPFFALVFSPLALFPLLPAYACWLFISLALFIAGFFLVWNVSSLPDSLRPIGLMLSLSFLPFASFCLVIGQSSAFGFFWLALAIYLDKHQKHLASGAALAFLLYKPTLLPLILLMLIVTGRWRAIAGFCFAGFVLGLLSLTLIGRQGLPLYLDMLSHFSQIKSSGKHPLWTDVDVYSAVAIATGNFIVARWVAIGVAAVVLPALALTWLRRPSEAWSTTITWTLMLAPYVLLHDVSLMVLAVVLTGGTVYARRQTSRTWHWLLFALYAAPWVTRQVAQGSGIQILTLVLVVFGSYQLYLSLRREPVLLNTQSTVCS
jgi:alpha-1,2-mannosyltransferase